MILRRHLLRVLSPAARFESLQVGNRKMKTRNAGAALYGLSFGKAYLIVAKETYTMTEDGQQACVGQEYSRWSFDLETGEMVELMTDTDGILPYMYGVWEDIAVYQTVKTVEGAPEFEELDHAAAGGHNVVSVRPAILQISRLFQKSQNRRKKKRS